MQAVERERARIAQDLHDDLCQTLTGISCLVQVSASRLSCAAPKETERLLDINRRVIEAMNSARAICHGLHPAQAVRANIRDTLRELARLSRERFPIKITTQFPQGGTRIPRHAPREQLLVFRIAQEAICNALRHGGATEIAISLDKTARGALRLRVADNGIGLKAEKNGAQGLGLRIMRCRASELNGSLTFGANPAPKKGACVQLDYSPGQDTLPESHFPSI